jgi:hypothetical protein
MSQSAKQLKCELFDMIALPPFYLKTSFLQKVLFQKLRRMYNDVEHRAIFAISTKLNSSFLSLRPLLHSLQTSKQAWQQM